MWCEPPVDLGEVSSEPGVYRMVDGSGELLYIGKARNLRRRVASYFQSRPVSPRTVAMVSQIREIQFTITPSEADALLLEHNLIKRFKPRYNVLLKDGKTYPWIVLTTEEFPRLLVDRKRKLRGEFFGPFPNVGAVRETIKVMQQLFRLRDCSDATFANRSRPCMQYQIGRCTAPCVSFVDRHGYGRQVDEARQFLQGRAPQLLEGWQQEMERAAVRMAFERAAQLRDRVRMLRSVVGSEPADDLPADADVLLLLRTADGVTAAVGVRRGGRDLGVQLLPVKQAVDAGDEEVLHALLLQLYHYDSPPPLLLLQVESALLSPLSTLLKLLAPHLQVELHSPQRGWRLQWLQQVRHSAEQSVAVTAQGDQQPAFAALAELLQLDEPPLQLAAVDNAHLGGEQMVAAVVFAGHHGALKELYRHYSLSGVAAGDDYEAMAAVLQRLFRAVVAGEMSRPDLLVIDGGRGQLAVAMRVAQEAGLSDLKLLAVSKGEGRRIGNERLWRGWVDDAAPLCPGRHSAALLLVARVRDEAHRFAGRYLRQRRRGGMFHSALDEVPGIGRVRRAALLAHFGGIGGVKAASRQQLQEVKGVSAALAEAVFMALRE
ncbi:MAG: excinuclease ABC subunit UvrC [Mariprofundales bacterium]|nr:excinuclease ABC subunit UvrC [Mariprofundales bacterium]